MAPKSHFLHIIRATRLTLVCESFVEAWLSLCGFFLQALSDYCVGCLNKNGLYRNIGNVFPELCYVFILLQYKLLLPQQRELKTRGSVDLLGVQCKVQELIDNDRMCIRYRFGNEWCIDKAVVYDLLGDVWHCIYLFFHAFVTSCVNSYATFT